MRASLALLSALLGASARPSAVMPSAAVMPAAAAIVGRGRDFNKILGKIIALFPINVGVDLFTDTLVGFETLQAATFDVPIVETISPSSPCADVSLFFARGTFEARNMGLLVGPPLADAVRDALTPAGTTVGVQGVEYPAQIGDYYDDDPTLGKYMADDVKQTLARCPNTKVVLSGYSQGAVMAHQAADELGEAVMGKSVVAFVMFGDPNQHEAVSGIDASRVKVFCHVGDDACNHGALLLPPHLTYGFDANEAAQFIKAQL